LDWSLRIIFGVVAFYLGWFYNHALKGYQEYLETRLKNVSGRKKLWLERKYGAILFFHHFWLGLFFIGLGLAGLKGMYSLPIPYISECFIAFGWGSLSKDARARFSRLKEIIPFITVVEEASEEVEEEVEEWKPSEEEPTETQPEKEEKEEKKESEEKQSTKGSSMRETGRIANQIGKALEGGGEEDF